MAWYRENKKETVLSRLKLDVRELFRSGYFKEKTITSGTMSWQSPQENGDSSVVASISFKADLTNKDDSFFVLDYLFNKSDVMNYKVGIARTYPNYGGVRYWFICPRCGRRVAILYSGKHFLCRTCHNLCYKSQQEGFSSRMMRKARKLEAKAQGEGGLKKKGMHWKTYNKLFDMVEECECLALLSFTRKLHKLRGF